jgi:hypothetical protein
MDESTVVPQKRKSRVWMFWTASIGFIFVIAMAIETLWHDKYFGVAQNESAAVGGLRKINTLENQYAASHADKGFACELSLLRPIEAVTDPYDPTSALLPEKFMISEARKASLWYKSVVYAGLIPRVRPSLERT